MSETGAGRRRPAAAPTKPTSPCRRGCCGGGGRAATPAPVQSVDGEAPAVWATPDRLPPVGLTLDRPEGALSPTRPFDATARAGRFRTEASTSLPPPWPRARHHEQLLDRGARALRGGRGLHRLGRGGVRAPRPRDARARQSLRGRAGRREGDDARAEPRGELIASEVEVKTGKQASFADVPAALAERRAELAALVEPLGLALGATGDAPVVELARPADHRHAALPAERRAPAVRRLAQQHLRDPHPRRDPGRRPRGPASSTRSATGCPSCSPCRRAPRSTRASTRGSTRRGPRCSPASSPAAACRSAFGSWDAHAEYVRFLYETGVGRRADAALVERASAPRFPDRRDPDLRRAARRRRGAVPRRADGLAHRALRPRARRGRAAAEHPHRLIEENMWRAIRTGSRAS